MKNNNVIIKFLFTSGISIIIDFSFYMVFCMQFDVTLSRFMATTIVCVMQYFMNRRYVFQVMGHGHQINQILKYLVCQCINIGSNVGTNWLIYNITKNKIISFVVATAVATMVNYLLQKFVVFQKATA